MQRTLWQRLSSLLIVSTAAAALLLSGCEGDKGDPGRDAVLPGPTPVNVTTLTPEQQSELSFQGSVTGVTVASPPVVTFRITDSNGAPIIGLNQRNSSNQLNNLAFTIAKLVPGTNGSPSRWVNYVVTSAPGAGTVAGARPTRDREGTLVDHGDGSYTYTFARDITLASSQVAGLTESGDIRRADLDDLTYNPNLTHRLVIEYGGNIANTTPTVAFENPLNIVYDFVPATGAAVTSANTQREIVTTEQCNTCHGRLLITGTAQFPHPAAVDTRYCAICHTSQRAFGRAVTVGTRNVDTFTGTTWVINEEGEVEVVGEFVNLIHKIHAGSTLIEQGYNYAGIEFNDLTNPANPSLCRRCHDDATAPQGSNWHNAPSRKACGSCHDDVHFATGTAHSAGLIVQTSDAACTGCHNSASIQQNHQVTSLSTTNTTTPAGLTNFFYEVASASVDPATNNLTVRFRIQRSTDTLTAERTNVVFTGAGFAPPTGTATADAVISGFSNSPSFLLAYALPQDGITAPADYNNLGKIAAQPDLISIANLLAPANAGTVGTITGPDASGYYTATILAARAFPPGATMRAVGIQGFFTQTGVTTGANRLAVSVITPVTGDAVRRRVVDSAKCDRCHERLEFHGGSRVYEIQLCVTCHNPNFTSSGRTITDAKLSAFNFTPLQQEILLGWDPAFNRATPGYALTFPETSNNLKDMIHGIHAGGERSTPFRDVRNGPGANITLIDAAVIDFPNILKNCEVCHVTSTGVNQQPTYRADLPPNVLPTTHVVRNAGSIAAPSATSIIAARTSMPNPEDLVIAPITASCISCHDDPLAKAHMQANGALLGAGLAGPTYTDLGVARATLDALGPPYFGEQCVLCHGQGRIADVVVVHQR